MRFTTSSFPREQRYEAWRFALTKLSLSLEGAAEELYGELVSFRSALGVEFTRIIATPGRLKIDLSEREDVIWLLILLEGRLTASDAFSAVEVRENDIIYGADNMIAHLNFARDYRAMFICVPRDVLNLRRRMPLSDKISHLGGDNGMGRIFSGMLRSVAEGGDDLTKDQLQPVEMVLPDLILNSVLEGAPARALGGAAGMRAVQLQRVHQTIEMRLSDPRLNLRDVASEHGISPRYMQKLFEENDQSFTQYVKLRRLERCRLDLISPLHTQKSISEILFQWGFNDSASFSRAFRDEYGMSPRQYRKSPPVSDGPGEKLQRGRARAGRDEQSASDLKLRSVEDENFELDMQESAEALAVGIGGGAQRVRHHFLPVSPETVHWGYFSRYLKPVLEVRSGDYVTIQTLTHHANDDRERMVEGDPGAESVYHWSKDRKAVQRRGAGPLDASAFGRGAGEGFGVHICTGPIAIDGAKPGDVVEVRILELTPRESGNPNYAGRAFGSNAAAYWGFHYDDLLTEPKPREVITIYEIESEHGRHCAHAVYNFRWTPQRDPDGILHPRIDYPGVPIDHSTIEKNFNVLQNVEIPLRPHFGVIGLAPAESGIVDSVPPANFGGNLDNWRLGAGSKVFLPVAVAGGMLSLGDPHASQGDSELCGTAIECSMNGVIQIILHRKGELSGHIIDLDYPLIETANDWVIFGFSYPDYLKELGEAAQSEVYKKSSIDLAMRDAFRKVRRFLMTTRNFTEDEAISLMSVAVDFGITQVVNGNWGVHAVIPKRLFTS